MSEPTWVSLLLVNTCQIQPPSTVRETELESSMWREPGDLKLCSILELILTTWMKHGNDGLTCRRRDFDYVIQNLLPFPNQEERDVYILERRTLVAILGDHDRMSGDWYDIQMLKWSRELENVKEERSQAIIQKLTELGYGGEIRNIWSPDVPLAKHSLVRQPRPLSEKVWNNIKPELIQYLDKMKAHRKARRRQKTDILREHKKTHPLFTVTPSVVDFLASPRFRHPLNTVLSSTPLAPIPPYLRRRIAFKLAFNAFYCNYCTIFARQINKRMKNDYPKWVTAGSRSWQARSTNELVANEDFRRVIRDVILSVGKDPKETTAQDMDIALEDVQFKCDECPHELSKDGPAAHRFLHFELYEWRKLVCVAFTYMAFTAADTGDAETDSLQSYVQLIESWSEDWEVVDEAAEDGKDCVARTVWNFLARVTIRRSMGWLSIYHGVRHVEAFVDIFMPTLERPFAARAARATEFVRIFPEGHSLRSDGCDDDSCCIGGISVNTYYRTVL
ncbi:hypothetical protein IW261DRAFT_1679504 [Armillaria novae-zelandiae]|uniref:Uncharacterized protein n=1 Tax=Armillaria novae-zelandiae TaxID=153914 RepID=A0AA39TE11_9AGAR|nr:hypothetical protein IW261DRAFT_1679504 [Armillaria novae-zelandiae]